MVATHKNILITGGAGFIGFKLIIKLSKSTKKYLLLITSVLVIIKNFQKM